ncbi:MAG: energy transducer TonB [Spirochaetales bacterium]|nr:MAG: energy transducer TonB [Spirochaetales bacterium]
MPDSGPPPVANRQPEVLPEPPAELPAAEPEPDGPAAVSSPYSAAADRDFSEKKPGSRAPAGGQLQVTVHQKENTITVPLFLPAMAVEPILPAYPRKAREKGIEGTVLIRLHVDAKGIPQSAEIAASSGSDLLDTSALKAVKAVKFLPAFEGEKPIASEVVVPIRFVLDDTQPE